MPEYLAPGVYVEETSFRAKSIEGLSTSTAGFVGAARFGPTSGVPQLLTSYADFERIYGGPEPLEFSGGAVPNFLAHAVRGFFDNSGQRLYVSRIYKGTDGHAFYDVPDSLPNAVRLRARYPGRGGNLKYTFTLRISSNVLAEEGSGWALRGVVNYDLLLVSDVPSLPPSLPDAGTLYWAEKRADNTWLLHGDSGNVDKLTPGSQQAYIVRCSVQVTYPGRGARTDVWKNLAFHPKHPQSLSNTFAADLKNRTRALTVPLEIAVGSLEGPRIATVLFGTIQRSSDGKQVSFPLSDGSDGAEPDAESYRGIDTQPKDKIGLASFEDIPEISIVAAPGSTHDGETTRKKDALGAVGYLKDHCERMKYRIAVVDSANGQSPQQALEFRSQFDSTHAALYYPWVRILDPVSGEEINVPGSGHVAGIFARNDVERGVHKAPTNEVVRGAIGLEVMLNKRQQDVLNPMGVNCFRYLKGRGNRLCAARTMSSHPEWRYVNLRRYFAYLERSIERGIQWAVFENNGPALWANVRRTIEDFLFAEWQSGRLLGEKPEEAYFVRCDRSTMSQNDLDSAWLIALIGVAPLRPAEFVILRIGQCVLGAKS